jgi:hypothetical protein
MKRIPPLAACTDLACEVQEKGSITVVVCRRFASSGCSVEGRVALSRQDYSFQRASCRHGPSFPQLLDAIFF